MSSEPPTLLQMYEMGFTSGVNVGRFPNRQEKGREGATAWPWAKGAFEKPAPPPKYIPEPYLFDWYKCMKCGEIVTRMVEEIANGLDVHNPICDGHLELCPDEELPTL